MRTFLLLQLFISSAFFAVAQDDEIDSSQDKIKVENAVVRWADSVFYRHSEYKFDNFRAEYSEGYFIAIMRSRAYKERVTDLEADKAAGRYKGTEEAYQKELQTLKDAYTKAQTDADNYVLRADSYTIHFWSNIQTTDGITVYYEHIVTLNNSYHVTSAVVNSAIGKKDENTQILYKKDVKTTTPDKKKVDDAPLEMKSSETIKTNSSSTNGTTETTTPVEGSKPKKEKKKKK
jgi:hypothetical protein